MDRDDEREETEEGVAEQGVPLRARLKVVAHYALLASPLLGLLGIILAVTALVLGRSSSAPDDSVARIASLSNSLTETRNELESLKFILARERATHAEERREDEAHTAKVVKHVSDLEKRQKISPTLEESLQQPAVTPASAPVAASHLPATAAAPVPAAVPPEKKTAPAPMSPQVKSLKEAIEKFNAK